MPAPSKSITFNILLDFPLRRRPEEPLATRETGQEELAALENELDAATTGDVVGVDVTSVRFINYSFSDECFGKLCGRLLSGEHKDRYVVLIAPDHTFEDQLQDISVALQNRKSAMLCSADREDPSGQKIIGELSENLRETLRAVQPDDTNEVLAAKLNIKLTTCINRTDKLSKMRLLRKSEHAADTGHRQYKFSPVLPVSQ